MTDYGTDKRSLQNTTGAIQSNAGDPLLSTDDFGASSYVFGAALSAGIYLGVQNGNIGAPTAAVGTADPISDDNPLPYFSSSDGSSGRITAAVVADSTSGSGYVVRFTMVNALSADEFYLERIISVPASRATTASFQPRGAWTAATNSASYRAFTRAQYITADGSTTTGASGTGEATGATIFSYNSTAREVQANPNTTGVAPTDSAYLRTRLGVRLTANIVGTASIDLVEVRIDTGRTQYILTDGDQPNSYGYGAVFETFGDLIIRPNETGLSGSNPQFRLKASNGDILLDASNKGTGGSVVVAGNIHLQHDTTNGKVWFGGTAGTGSLDTNLYRSAADTLKTDDSLIVSGTLTVGGNSVVGIPAGVVQSYLGGTSTIPTGWLLANGASLSTATYPALFAVIGYSFGGAGASFSLPSLTGHLLVGSTSTPGSSFQTGSADAWLNATWNHTHSTNPAAFNSAASATSQIVASGSGAGPSALSHVHSIDVPATTSSDAGPADVLRTRVVYIVKT